MSAACMCYLPNLELKQMNIDLSYTLMSIYIFLIHTVQLWI